MVTQERLVRVRRETFSMPRWYIWLHRVFIPIGAVSLPWCAFHYAGPTDLRYAALYLAYTALPLAFFLLLPVGIGAIQRWRTGWFKEQAEIEKLLAEADARGENPDHVYEQYMLEKHGFELTSSAPTVTRELTDAELAGIHRGAAVEVNLMYNREWKKRALIVLTIAAEDGLFFAPIALFGLPWWAMTISATLWGFAHYPLKSAGECLWTAGFGTLVGLTVLPHGILTNALGHFLHDYIIAEAKRLHDRWTSALCLD